MSEFSFSRPSGSNIRVGFGCHVVLAVLKVNNGSSLLLLLPIKEFVASHYHRSYVLQPFKKRHYKLSVEKS